MINNINLGIDSELARKTEDYLNNPNPETLESFNEELKISNSTSSIAVLLDKLKNVTGKKEYCDQLIDLILLKFEPEEPREGVYDPMLGEIVYADEVQKKKM